MQRHRRKRRGKLADEQRLNVEYLERAEELKGAIRKAKTRAWGELMQTLDKDPRGKPYRSVMKKIRARSMPSTISFDPEIREEIINELFPGAEIWVRRGSDNRKSMQGKVPDRPNINRDEISRTLKRKEKKFVTPGMDEIYEKVISSVANFIPHKVLDIFQARIMQGKFPKALKCAELILIPKPGKKDNISPSAYRPICLISEVGKILKRITVDRIVHLEGIGPNISEKQFGFRRGRSTADAIDMVIRIATDITNRGGIALAVSLDIANAFNSIQWEKIHTALIRHRIPDYIREVIGDYLRDRKIMYNVGNSRPLVERNMERGVRPGSKGGGSRRSGNNSVRGQYAGHLEWKYLDVHPQNDGGCGCSGYDGDPKIRASSSHKKNGSSMVPQPPEEQERPPPICG